MEDLNIYISHARSQECVQNPEIEEVEITIDTPPKIKFYLDNPEEGVSYSFEREPGEPENLVKKTIVIDHYRVQESSQSPMIETMYGNIVLHFLDDVKVLSFDLEEK